MNTWRLAIMAIILIALALILLSVLKFEDGWSWYPWHTPSTVRKRIARPWQGDTQQNLAALVASLIAQYLGGVIVLFVMPRRVRVMADAVVSNRVNLFRYLAAGFLSSVVVFGILVALAFSFQTFPLIFILGLMFFMTALSGAVALTFQLGRELLVRAGWRERSPLIAQALGTLIYFALSRVPYFGVFVYALIWFTGVGVAIATKIGTGKSWSLAPLTKEKLG